MNYVFRYVGDVNENDNRFFYDITPEGMLRTVLQGFHASKFDSRLVDIFTVAGKLGWNYQLERWTPELDLEPAHKNAPPGWWIGPLVIIVFLIGLVASLIVQLIHNFHGHPKVQSFIAGFFSNVMRLCQ